MPDQDQQHHTSHWQAAAEIEIAAVVEGRCWARANMGAVAI